MRAHRLAIVGTFVSDRIRPWRGQPFSDLGGLIYTLLPLAALRPPDWELMPVAHVGADLWSRLRRELQILPGVGLDGLRKVAEPNNRVTLSYRSARDRDERLEGGVPALGTDAIRIAAAADFILLNYVSGYELDAACWRRLRRGAAPIYADLHSLFLGRSRSGLRYLRRPPAWRDRLRGLTHVQLNEVEAACLLGAKPPLRSAELARLRRAAIRQAVQTLIVTQGERGAWFAPAPPARPAAVAAVGGRGREPTGCGDAFAAGFVAALLHGLGPRQALDAAVRCAGIKAQRRGTRGLYAAVRRRRAWILGAGR